MQAYIPALVPLEEKLKGYAYPLLRFVAGALLVPHGMQKIFGLWGGNIEGTAKFFANVGLEPSLQLAYLVGCTELIGGTLIAIGLFTRFAAAAAFIMLTVAWYTVHLKNGLFWTKGGIEYPLLWSLVMVVILFRGSGKLSVDERLGKEL